MYQTKIWNIENESVVGSLYCPGHISAFYATSLLISSHKDYGRDHSEYILRIAQGINYPSNQPSKFVAPCTGHCNNYQGRRT